MKPDETEPLRLDDAIIVDEIGLKSGGYGLYRLRSQYQPIFEGRGRNLHMVAVEGTVTPFVAGEVAPPEMFRIAVTEDDRDFVARMGIALALRNQHNLEVEGLDLIVSARFDENDHGAPGDRVAFIAGELAEHEPELEFEAGQVFCAFAHTGIPEGLELAGLARQCRELGLRIAIGDFGAGHWTDEQIGMLDPDIVRIDGGWFHQVCRDATTVRLFDSVVSRLRDRRCKVLVSGIATEQQLGVALRAGGHLFQGDHLALPAHAGVAVDDNPLSIAQRLGDARKIVPLFG
ncbi:MAG: EAL domain-containing protein [Hyphomicrobiales bacterium]|nr:EAL domain-containing protein [Hyphomicrobiales bacterium]